MRLVVGLGNPGERYAATRHNVAWWTLDELLGRWPAETLDVPGVSRVHRIRVRDVPLELLRPLTYMNLAGAALRHWVQQNQASPEDLLVVTDDVYLPIGRLRLRARGSSGGHRGLESVEEAVGHREFARLRIGVGAADSSAELRDHVLETFNPEEEARAREAVRRAADAVECWATEGLGAAMNRFNRRISEEVSES